MKKSGDWTSQWQQTWDTFNENVDLFTFGTALLASNDGSRSFAQNMGYALQAGKEAKLTQEANTYGRAQEAQKAAMDERGLRVKEYNSQVDAAYKKAMSNIAGMKDAAGIDPAELPSKANMDAVGTFVQQKVKDGGFGAELADDGVLTEVTMRYKQALEASKGTGKTPKQVFDDVWNSSVRVQGGFSVGDTYEIKP